MIARRFAACCMAMAFLAGATSGAAHEGGFTRTEARLNYGQTERNLGLIGGVFDAAPMSPEVRELLAQAVRLAGTRKFYEAAAVHGQVSAMDPYHGLPAEARFLRLLGDADRLAAFRTRLDDPAAAFAPMARARALAALGEDEAVVAVLGSAETVRDGTDVAAVMLLANTLGRLGREKDREQTLADAALNAPAGLGRVALVEALLSRPTPTLLAQPERLARVIEAGVMAMAPDAATNNELLFQAAINFVDAPDYTPRRDALMKAAPDIGPGAVWFVSRLLVREERFGDALAWVAGHEQRFDSELLLREKAMLLRNLGRAEEAGGVLAAIVGRAAQADGPGANQLRWELAGIALGRGDRDGALANLARVDPTLLHPAERNAYWFNYIGTIAKMGDLDRLADLYPAALAQVREDDWGFLHQTIFEAITETDQHVALEALIRRRFDRATEPAPPARLWLLAAGAAEQARRMPNRIEALFRWVQAEPTNTYALGSLAADVVPLAMDLSRMPAGAVAMAPEGEPERVRELAESVLRRLVALQPYVTENYHALMELLRSEGNNAGALAVVTDVAAATDQPRLLGHLAFVLATGGFPKESIALYDRALELEPEAMAIRVNRAAALTRVGRTDEAVVFYKGLLENGANGVPFHLHDMILRLWEIAAAEGTEDRLIAYFREAVADRIDPAWRLDALSDIATALAHGGEFDAATEFYTMLTDDPAAGPARHARAWQARAQIAHGLGDESGAIKLLAQGERALADAGADEVIDMRNLRAELLARAGRTAEAVTLLATTAREFAHDEFARSMTFRAAELSEAAGNIGDARQYYAEFLRADTRDFPRRQRAEQWLKQPAIP